MEATKSRKALVVRSEKVTFCGNDQSFAVLQKKKSKDLNFLKLHDVKL